MKILKKTFLLIFSFFCAIFFSQTLSSNLDKTTLALGEVAVFKIQILDLNGQDAESKGAIQYIQLAEEVLLKNERLVKN